MQKSRVRSLLLVVSCTLLAAWTPVSVQAAPCPKICNQKTVWGIGPQSTNFSPCECTTIVNGLGSGPNSCVCGICYQPVGGRISGYGKKDDGSCPNGATDCGDCDPAAGSGSEPSTTSPPTTAPPSTEKPASNTPSPALTTSAPSPPGTSSSAAGNTTLEPFLPTATATPSPSPTPTNLTTATDVPSPANVSNQTINATDGKPGTPPANSSTPAPPAPTTATSSSNDGLMTWQIALIICSCVLVMAVVMMTITSCYCKARNRMKDNMQTEEERHEYEGYWNPNASGGMTERSGNEPLAQSAFNPAMTMGGRSSFTSTHSRPNSAKNMPRSEPTYAVDERIGAGMGRPAARQSLTGSADLPGVFQALPPRDRHDANSRKHIAIEL